MKIVRVIVMLLVIIGALNWGLIGFFDYDLVADIFGGYGSTGARTVFSIVGLAGLVAAFRFIRKCCHCNSCNSCKCCGKDNCQCNRK
ncbi:MAG TPA: DUF378 domain-containing protein [Chlamydiales bacterium]|jgi:hypothetical protein|nr:DUF378 domain-containing protein [Chlamydiales bacterium]